MVGRLCLMTSQFEQCKEQRESHVGIWGKSQCKDLELGCLEKWGVHCDQTGVQDRNGSRKIRDVRGRRGVSRLL